MASNVSAVSIWLDISDSNIKLEKLTSKFALRAIIALNSFSYF